MKNGISNKIKNRIKKAAILLFWLTVWSLLALAVNNKILLVTPFQTLKELLSLFRSGAFYFAVARSLLRICTGFFAGFAAAVILAACSNRFHWLEELLSPVMGLFKAVPVASFVVLFLIWWGASFLAVAICFLVVLPNIYIGALEGLKNVDKDLVEMAEVFRLSLRNRFFYIYRPALKPFLYSSMKVALGMSWKSGVAAEVIGTPDFSIGEQIYLSKLYLNTSGVFAWTAVVIVLSFFLEKLVLRMTEGFFAWQPDCGQGRSLEPAPASGRAEGSLRGRLVLEDVCKGFGEQRVLADVSRTYEPGRIYYLTEPSGSGKTTLLRLLAGLEQPDSGSVTVFGACSMVFQEDRLCEQYSAVKNVELVMGDEGRARDALAQLLEADALDKPCEQLSGGMKRRVALVRAMESASDCVLLDEPFTGMDTETRIRAEAYIRCRQRGRTLLIATHVL